jgi:hypothetical protein
MDWRVFAVLAAVFLYDGISRMNSDGEAEVEGQTKDKDLSPLKPGADGLAFPDHAPNHYHVLYCSS